MRIYIAAEYRNKMAARQRAAELRADGHEVTSTWLDEEYAPDTQLGDLEPMQTAGIAACDIEDILASDTVVLFTSHDETPRAGRHFETGFCVARNINLVICGPRVHAFHYLDLMPEFLEKWECGKITQFDEWNQVRTYLKVLEGLERPN